MADFPAGTRAVAAEVIAQHMPGATPKDAAWERDKARMDPRRQAAMARRLAHPDYSGESTRERAERMRQHEPVQLSQVMSGDDAPLHGSMRSFTWGDL